MFQLSSGALPTLHRGADNYPACDAASSLVCRRSSAISKKDSTLWDTHPKSYRGVQRKRSMEGGDGMVSAGDGLRMAEAIPLVEFNSMRYCASTFVHQKKEIFVLLHSAPESHCCHLMSLFIRQTGVKTLPKINQKKGQKIECD